MNRESSSYQIFKDQIRDNKYLLISFLVSTLVLLLPIIFNQFPTTQVSTKKIVVEANNEGVKINGGEWLCKNMQKGDQINIQVLGTLDELYNYQNLFQTSDVNSGIRFEIDGLGQGGLIVGSTTVDGYSDLLIPGKFVVGKFDILIRIYDGSRISVSFLNESTEKSFEGLNPICDNFVVGYGYDSDRLIKGDIQFTASASYLSPRFIPIWLENGVRIDWFRALITSVFLFTALAIAFRISTDFEDEAKSTHEKQDCI
jgi:hypothetical protein